MRYLRVLDVTYDVAPIAAELDAHPELWDRYTLRTRLYGTPHLQVSDIWCRYRAWSDLVDERARYAGMRLTEEQDRGLVSQWAGTEHESAWYEAIDALPALRATIFDLMRHFEVERLGGVLITRIPPGGRVEPHVDHGWHAAYYEKLALQVKGNVAQAFGFTGDGEFRCEAGAVYTFDNSKEHYVTNESQDDRVTAIICARRDQRRPTLVREWSSRCLGV